MRFRVWATKAGEVELEANGQRYRMEPQADGWWSVEVAAIEPGTDYLYHLDGGPGLPDPRSPWQPKGPFGPSRTVDHDAFRWSDRNWQARPLSSAVIYELHVGTFTPQGTFTAILDRLDHLLDLGVTHVELMPVAEFLGVRGWGYDGVDLFAPYHHYGTPDELKHLVNACHEAGLAVLLDVVYNHLGPAGNFLPQFGPYFTDRHHTAWGAAVNFDGPGSDEVRRFFCDNALMWLRDYHFDGLRLDAVHAIIDTSAIPFLEQLAAEVENLQAHLGRHLVLIAESDLNDPKLVRPRGIGGFGLDAHWSDDFHHALHTVLTGETSGYYVDFGSIGQLAGVMERPYIYGGCPSAFRQRCHGRAPDGLSAHRFVVCLQNHDQVGNRAHGDRISHLVNEDRAKVGAALTLLSPYVPLVFQGEEWSAGAPFQYFVDFRDDPDLARAVSEGRRHEFAAFGWKPEDVPDPQSEETFRRCRLDWREISDPRQAAMLDWYRELIRLRRQFAAMTDGRLEKVRSAFDAERRWLSVERGPITILCNLSDQPQEIPIARGRPAGLLLASKTGMEIREGGALMPAESVAVLGPGPEASLTCDASGRAAQGVELASV